MEGVMFQAVMQVMGSDGERLMELRSPATHLLLCGPAPNRLQTSSMAQGLDKMTNKI